MLLDTSGLLALLDSREPLNQLAIDRYRHAEKRLTHGYVLAELVALANSRKVPSANVLEFIKNLIANPDIEVAWPDESLPSQAVSLLIARQGSGYSLCDAVSFVLMCANNVQNALSTDGHFEDEGFNRLLR